MDLVAWFMQSKFRPRKGSLLVFWATPQVTFQGLVRRMFALRNYVHVTCVQLKLTEICGYEMMRSWTEMAKQCEALLICLAGKARAQAYRISRKRRMLKGANERRQFAGWMQKLQNVVPCLITCWLLARPVQMLPLLLSKESENESGQHRWGLLVPWTSENQGACPTSQENLAQSCSVMRSGKRTQVCSSLGTRTWERFELRFETCDPDSTTC